MKIKNIIKYSCLTIIWICISGCEDFLDIELPKNQLFGDVIFAETATADAALSSIYSKIQSQSLLSGNSSGFTLLLGAYTDETVIFSASGQPEESFFQNNITPSTLVIGTIWNNAYRIIYEANAVIEGVNNSTTINNTDKDRLIGEAIFIRALMHFYLTNVFGEIPYVSSTDYRINSSITKETEESIWIKIDDDLIIAMNRLPENYTGSFRSKPNKSAAKSLLSRVKLYMGNALEAEVLATEVINNTALYTWEDDINAVFGINSNGTIWQLLPGANGLNTLEGQSFIFLSGPPPIRALSSSLINSFEANDLRRQEWIKEVSNGSQSWHHSYKYKLNGMTSNTEECSIVLRLEELYLIRAEAKALQGNITEALLDVNKIRTRAQLPDILSQNQTDLIQKIMTERRLEFFTEFGHRFMDLKRTNTIDNVLSNTKPGWSTKNKKWPLPEQEIMLNSNLLPQNQGY